MADRVDDLVAEGRFERVQKNPAAVSQFLQQASLDAQGARRELAAGNPTGAYTLLWDAPRKTVTAHALSVGLKPSSLGAHASLVTYAEERLSEVAEPSDVDALDRMRRTRHRFEYDAIPIRFDVVESDLPVVGRLLESVLYDLDVIPKAPG